MIVTRAGAVVLALAGCTGCAGGGQEDSRTDPSVASLVSVGSTTETSSGTTGAVPTTGMDAEMTGTTAEPSGSSSTGEASSTGAVVSTGELSSSGGEDSSTGVAVGCGDAVLMDPELCDDGNVVDGDGCNADCTPSGQLLWSVLQAGDVGLAEEGIGCAVDAAGSVYVTGFISVAKDNADLWLRKYSFGGAPLWTQTVAGTGLLMDQGRAVVVDATELVYVAGYLNTLGQDNDGFVRQFAADGATLWTKGYAGAAMLSDVASAAVLTPDGNLLVAGATTVDGAGTNNWLRKYTLGGMVLWTRGHNGASNGNDGTNALAVTSEGDIYAAGQEGVAGEGTNIWLAKYDVDGNELWSKLYAGAGGKNDYLHGAVALADGGVVVCGYETALEIPWKSFLRRYDPTGKIVWTEVEPGPDMLGALCYGLDLAANGDILLTGAVMQGEQREPRVRRLTADGAELWSTVVAGAGAGTSQGRCVKAAPDGTIVVTGSLDDGSDGRDIWVARFSP